MADMINCACGCGSHIPSKDSRGRDRKYMKNHTGGLQKVRRGGTPVVSSQRVCKDCNKEFAIAEFQVFKKNGVISFVRRCRSCKQTAAAASKYGISVEEVKLLRSSLECEICGRIAEAIDHDHESGKVRGRLCNKCNTALGLFEDKIDVLGQAIQYLLKDADVLGKIEEANVLL